MSGPATPAAAFKMIEVNEALEIVLSHTEALPVEVVPFQAALKRNLAEDVRAAEPVPGYRASIKDGYAVVSSDGPGEYTVALEAHAGKAPEALTPGTVAYISTGGPVPEGADAVVQIEDTQPIDGPGKVKIMRQVLPGEDIREVGSDMAAGEVALPARHHIGAAEIGILATVGATQVSVHRTPLIAVLSTGDEVEEPSVQSLTPGKVRDANRAMLLAAAHGAGARTLDLGIAADSAEQVEAALDKAISAGADVLLTTGGVSMGDKDYVKPLLERRGEIFFGKVCMKPGKPLTFAKIPIKTGNSSDGSLRHLLVFGLPGNPASSLVTFHLVVVPCLRKLEGRANPCLTRVHVRTTFPIKMDPQRPEYYRAILKWACTEGEGGDGKKESQGEFYAESTGGQISSRILSLRSANALLEVPKAKGVLPAGTILSALVIGDVWA